MTDRFTLTDDDITRILNAIPPGEEPVSGHAVSKRVDVWAKRTCKQKLALACKKELIKRKPRRTSNGEMYVYWRDTPAPAADVETTMLGAG